MFWRRNPDEVLRDLERRYSYDPTIVNDYWAALIRAGRLPDEYLQLMSYFENADGLHDVMGWMRWLRGMTGITYWNVSEDDVQEFAYEVEADDEESAIQQALDLHGAQLESIWGEHAASPVPLEVQRSRFYAVLIAYATLQAARRWYEEELEQITQTFPPETLPIDLDELSELLHTWLYNQRRIDADDIIPFGANDGYLAIAVQHLVVPAKIYLWDARKDPKSPYYEPHPERQTSLDYIHPIIAALNVYESAWMVARALVCNPYTDRRVLNDWGRGPIQKLGDMFGSRRTFVPCFISYAIQAYTLAIHAHTASCFNKQEQDRFDSYMIPIIKKVLIDNQDQLHPDVFRQTLPT